MTRELHGASETYNPLGTDACGNVPSYQYDALNRLILTTYPDSTTASEEHDLPNNVLREGFSEVTALLGRQPGLSWSFAEFLLSESHLGPIGAHHEVRERFLSAAIECISQCPMVCRSPIQAPLKNLSCGNQLVRLIELSSGPLAVPGSQRRTRTAD